MIRWKKAVSRLKRIKLGKGPNFRNEIRIANGRSIPCKNDSPSILFATIHKAASVYVWEILKQATILSGMPHANFDGYNFFQGRLGESLDSEKFLSRGFLYGPFRTGFSHVSNWDGKPPEGFRILIQLRDPRDALTSSYYSFLKSHCVPRKDRRRIRALREELVAQDFGKFVREQAKTARKLLTQYSSFFERKNCCIVHYEDMVLNPKKWIEDVANFLGNDSPESSRVFQQVIDAASQRPVNERPERHRRKVTPGDFRSKLPPELVAELNDQFKDYFNKLSGIGKLPDAYVA